MKSWKKLFSVEDKNICLVLDSNRYLKGLIVDHQVILPSDGVL